MPSLLKKRKEKQDASTQIHDAELPVLVSILLNPWWHRTLVLLVYSAIKAFPSSNSHLFAFSNNFNFGIVTDHTMWFSPIRVLKISFFFMIKQDVTLK